jgi:hypothetical protein
MHVHMHLIICILDIIQGVSKVADTLLELGSIHFRVSTTVVSFILSKFVETQ